MKTLLFFLDPFTHSKTTMNPAQLEQLRPTLKLLNLKVFHCCNHHFIWFPEKDIVLLPEEDPPKKAWLVHACKTRAIWNDRAHGYFKSLNHEQKEN
jgi:hypothetical protein